MLVCINIYKKKSKTNCWVHAMLKECGGSRISSNSYASFSLAVPYTGNYMQTITERFIRQLSDFEILFTRTTLLITQAPTSLSHYERQAACGQNKLNVFSPFLSTKCNQHLSTTSTLPLNSEQSPALDLYFWGHKHFIKCIKRSQLLM